MSTASTSSALDLVDGWKKSGSETQETIENMTRTSGSYSSTTNASRRHMRLKMSDGRSASGLGLHGERSAMKQIPSLLQQLPGRDIFNGVGSQATSAVTNSALKIVERVFDDDDDDDDIINSAMDPKKGSGTSSAFSSQAQNVSYFEKDSAPIVNLDTIDVDNITIGDLQGLQAADGDTLRAKHLNKLSRKEREHVLQDIHGVADVMEETTNVMFVNESLEKLQIEIGLELVHRKSMQNPSGDNTQCKSKEDSKDSRQRQEVSVSTSGVSEPKLSGLEDQLGQMQQKLDQLVRQRNNLSSCVDLGGVGFEPSKQVSAKNHPMFGKVGDIGGFGTLFEQNNKRHARPISVPSNCFGRSSSFFSPTTAMPSSGHMSNTNEAQQDADILNNKDAIAYEQALAQCRGRRRERNNSLFLPITNGRDGGEDDGLDESRYIDVEQRDFRLSFLRAERYDTKNAACRFIDYFEEKRRLFGINHLTSRLQLEDLDAEAKECLESGQIQLLQGRDRAGRAVVVGTKKLALNRSKRKDENSILRALWILSSIALEDVETEKNGVVFVNYTIGGDESRRIRERGIDQCRRRIRQWGNVLRALPLRVASIHWCVQNHTLKQAANLSALMLGGSNFARVRCHAGTDMEVQYDLMTFGIPTDLFPVSMNGEVNLSRHHEFLQERKKIETSSLLNRALALVETPILDDCLEIDVNDDNIKPVQAVVPSSSMGVEIFASAHLLTEDNSHRNLNNNGSNNYTPHNQCEQQHQYQQKHNRTTVDYGYNNNNHHNFVDNIAPTSFNDSFCFVGNMNSMQMQSSHQPFQPLNNFQQQQQFGMNMGMGQKYPQHQQLHRQQHHQNQASEKTSQSKSGIPYSMEPVLVPGELDILLGRGRGAQNHKGNIHYRQVVETFRARYEQIPQKGAKTQLIREVVAVIYDNGGRFLKQDSYGRWIPVDPEVARDKVSHSFRNQKRLSLGGGSSTTDEPSSSKKRPRDETK